MAWQPWRRTIIIPPLLILLLVTKPVNACVRYAACPLECACWQDSSALHVQCTTSGLQDHNLKMLLDALPEDATDITIAGTNNQPNNFTVTNDFVRFRRLRTLRMQHCSIRALGKRTFADMKNLRLLDVSNNLIEQLIPETFEESEHIEHLYLDQNKLSRNRLPTSAFVYLSRLKTLSVAWNNLKDLPSSFFNGLYKLETLILSGNPQGTFPGGFFSQLRNLKSLHVDGVGIENFCPEALRDITTLNYLNLAHNKLYYFPTNVFEVAPSLQELDLSFNHISLLPSKFLASTNLAKLSLRGNKLSSIRNQADIFANSSLVDLDLGENGFDTVPMQILAYTPPSLQTLRLSGNNLSPYFSGLIMDPVSAKEMLQHVTELHIANTGLRKLLPPIIGNTFPYLRILNVSNNPLDDDSIAVSTLRALQQLHTLDVSNCDLRSPSKDLYVYFDENRLHTLLAAGNPWDCENCHITLLRDILEMQKRSEENCTAMFGSPATDQAAAQVMCAKPAALSRRSLLDVTDYDIPYCSPIFGAVGLTVGSEIGIIAAGICGLLLLVILVAAVLCSYLWPKADSYKTKEEERQNLSASSSETSALQPVSVEKLF